MSLARRLFPLTKLRALTVFHRNSVLSYSKRLGAIHSYNLGVVNDGVAIKWSRKRNSMLAVFPSSSRDNSLVAVVVIGLAT
jgi:hypothetical protein